MAKKILLNHAEVCAFAQISYTTLRRMLAEGRINNECPGAIAMSEFRRVFGSKPYIYAKQCLALKAELFTEEEDAK